MVVHKGWWPEYTSGITKLVCVKIQTNSEHDLIFFSSGKTSVIGGEKITMCLGGCYLR